MNTRFCFLRGTTFCTSMLALVTMISVIGCGRSGVDTVKGGRFPEELVHVRTADDFVEGGVIFVPSKEVVKPIAVIWIHGWGVNFYSPTYVNIGRELAERGYTCISGNTRMHDLGNVLGRRDGKRVRGGGYWGVASEEVRDLAAWIDFAERRGFTNVVLVGHSAGWAAVRRYQSETQDRRVVGVVLASGAVRAETRTPDAGEMAQATQMMAAGRGDDLVRITNRPYPSFISAATFMDIANMPEGEKDFFGMQATMVNPGVTRISCPLLAWFGTREREVGTADDLERLKASVARQKSGPNRVETTMIDGADHMYEGEESQVAETLAKWVDTLQHAAPKR